MIFNMSGSGGGASLNFKVVGNPQPAAPAENTIWIDTDTPITSWIFSAAEPEAPSEGMVWFSTGAASPVVFNALKKNGIQVYPLSAKQYISGVLVDKTAKSYQGGSWVEWTPVGALYYFGNECIGASGGWQARGWNWNSDSLYKALAPTLTKTNEYMEIIPSTGGFACGVVEVMVDQDLTNVNQLTIDLEGSMTRCNVNLAVLSRSASYLTNPVCSVSLIDVGGPTATVSLPRTVVTLDVSSVTGLHDIVISFVNQWSGDASGLVKVYSVFKK